MQDIVFYTVANETLGMVRDYANARKMPAPVLTLGVSVCLRMRLFSSLDTATPYPLAAFGGISDWQWRMDGDFDQATTCKLIADTNGISVHSVTDTVNGETTTFTEFVIPISNMNTQELCAWLGNEKKRSGLTGELVGYDSEEKAAFVLQIENFTVRNRVAGLGTPTAVQQETMTYAQTEHLIQAAVSSSAETKQDKLTSANAGTGISITEGGTISTADIPQSVVTGLDASLAAKQNNITAGYGMELIGGSTVGQKRYFQIESPVSSAVTLQAGHAYRINATAGQKTLNAETMNSNEFGLDGHIELFVANTGYVHTGANVVLSQPLEPDAVNNCTVRFHDGLAIISVEDHVAGYIVVSATGSTSGTLPYGLSSASQAYVAFDASLNGQTFDLGGVATNGEKHVVGNGYADTVVTGGLSCTSKTTFANLSMVDVSMLGGAMTLGDVYIPSGSTVGVSGGGIILEKAVGSGVIDASSGIDNATVNVNITGITFTGGANTSYLAYLGSLTGDKNRSGSFTSCTFSSIACSNGRALYVGGASSSPLLFEQCSFDGSYRPGSSGVINALQVPASRYARIKDCTFGENQGVQINGMLYVNGSNSTLSYLARSEGNGSMTIESGAIIDLTGNTTTTPIRPGGGVTFSPGGATVYPSAGSASAYMLGGMTVPQIGNTNVVNLNSTNVVNSNSTAYASGCSFINGHNTNAAGGCFYQKGGLLTISSCSIASCSSTDAGGGIYAYNTNVSFFGTTISSCVGVWGGGCYIASGTTLQLDSCLVSGNTAGLGQDIDIASGGTVILSGSTIGDCVLHATGASAVIVGSNNVEQLVARNNTVSATVTISSGTIIDLTSSIAPGGGIIIPSGADININDNDYNAFGGITASSVNSSGYIGGATISIPDGATCTYTYHSGGVETTTSAVGPAAVVVDGELSFCG